MNLDSIMMMRAEFLLLFQILFLIIYDLFVGNAAKKTFDIVACTLFFVLSIVSVLPCETGVVFGGMFISNAATQLMKGVLSLGVILVFLQSNAWLNTRETITKKVEFYVLTLSTLFGMNIMISAGHFLMFYLGLELASLPLIALVAYNKTSKDSVEAGAKFALVAAFSSAMMLFGIALFYGVAGLNGLYFDSFAIIDKASPLVIMALMFFFAGMAFKISLVPFHLWTADVYQGAPTNVSAYLSVLSKGAAVFAFMLITLKVFVPIFEFWQEITGGLVVLTITIANIFAIRQKNIKRFLAFSSISQAGYIMLGMMSGSRIAMASVIFYILVYLVSNLGIFAIVSIFENSSEKESKTRNLLISDYNGLYKSNPYLSVGMTLFLFSLAGIPPFAGFFSKFFVFMAAAESKLYVLVFIALVNTIISLYYYLLIVKAMFIIPNESPIPTIKTDCYSKIGLAICLVGTLFLGIASCVYAVIQSVSFGL